METKTVYLKQINIITISEYTLSNVELDNDIKGNSMSVEEYINMVLCEYSESIFISVDKVEIFHKGITEMNTEPEYNNKKSKTPIAIIHYTKKI